MSHFSFEIDPLTVLGVPADASLQQIRDAYREKAKRYHPDKGGEDWVFRIVSQSYELLSSARVVRAAHFEAAPPTARRKGATPSAETVHAGIHDRDVDPMHLVAVEHLCVRYNWEDASYLWLGQGVPEDQRFLSCSLNLNWPDASQVDPSTEVPGADEILSTLAGVFDAAIIGSPVINSRSHIEDGRFSGWLSYAGFDRSWKALQALHQSLRQNGLGLRQWSRDLFIPRGWQFDRTDPHASGR